MNTDTLVPVDGIRETGFKVSKMKSVFVAAAVGLSARDESLFLFGWVIADPAGNRFATGFKLVMENRNALFGVDPSDR